MDALTLGRLWMRLSSAGQLNPHVLDAIVWEANTFRDVMPRVT
jgi:hypothetical protein